jgi:hypothetical protein
MVGIDLKMEEGTAVDIHDLQIAVHFSNTPASPCLHPLKAPLIPSHLAIGEMHKKVLVCDRSTSCNCDTVSPILTLSPSISGKINVSLDLNF